MIIFKKEYLLRRYTPLLSLLLFRIWIIGCRIGTDVVMIIVIIMAIICFRFSRDLRATTERLRENFRSTPEKGPARKGVRHAIVRYDRHNYYYRVKATRTISRRHVCSASSPWGGVLKSAAPACFIGVHALLPPSIRFIDRAVTSEMQ